MNNIGYIFKINGRNCLQISWPNTMSFFCHRMCNFF